MHKNLGFSTSSITLFSFSLILAILINLRWYLIGLLNLPNYLHWTRLFTCWVDVCILAWKNVYSGPLLIFLNFFFFSWAGSSLNILDINPSSDMWFISIFSHSVGCLFTLDCPLYRSFNFWCSPVVLFFPFVAFALGVMFKKTSPNPMYWHLSPYFKSFSFVSLIHFELILEYGVE